MLKESITIDFEEYVKCFLKKWKITLCIIMIFVVAFTSGTILLGEEISVPHSEEYLHYEKELEYHKTYLEESILMNLDPTCVYARTLYLRNCTDKELLKDYATSAEIWRELETERSKTYISELVIWNENEETGTIELKLRHGTSEECKEWAEFLKERLLAYDSTVEIIIGAEEIFSHESLQEEHLRWYSRIDYVNSLLLEAEAGYTIKINPLAAAITGCILGFFVSLMIVLVQCLKDRR